MQLGFVNRIDMAVRVLVLKDAKVICRGIENKLCPLFYIHPFWVELLHCTALAYVVITPVEPLGAWHSRVETVVLGLFTNLLNFSTT